MSKDEYRPRIAIVGPCGAGKTTLSKKLQALGFDARQIAQEHSFAQRMWRILTQPDILIFLDVSFQNASTRKQFHWIRREYSEQLRRLKDARRNCDIYVDTDDLSPDEVLETVLARLDIGHFHCSDV
jgi:thymidylate kinase